MKTKSGDANIEKEKLEIIKWITTLKDDSSIEKLKMLRTTTRSEDWWLETSDEEKAAIDKGLADISAGRLKPHKVAKKIYAKWL